MITRKRLTRARRFHQRCRRQLFKWQIDIVAALVAADSICVANHMRVDIRENRGGRVNADVYIQRQVSLEYIKIEPVLV